MTYTEAVEILEAAQAAGTKFEYPVSWGCDLQTEHERFLTEQHFTRPTFVTDYPVEIKAFYMRLNDDGKTVAAMDCLVPGIGEIIGGSQREERLDVLERRIRELGMDPDQLATDALADACYPGNPREADHETVKELFRKIMA